jgi:hypothetical protein
MEDTAQPVLSHPSSAGELSAESGSTQPLLHSVPAQLPWWAVSIAFHGLVIALAGLISLAIIRPATDYHRYVSLWRSSCRE